MNHYDKIIYFDLETTGFDGTVDKVIEFGARVVSKDTTEELNWLVNPGVPILNSHIHHITDEMVEKDGLHYDDFCNKIKALFQGNILVVAYNIQFDSQFINHILGHFKFDMLDIMAIYKDRHGYPWKLDNAVRMYNVNIINTHRALDDVDAMMACLEMMKKEKDNIDDYVNNIGYYSKYGVSGIKFDQCTYIPQFGGCREIERMINNE